MNIFVRFYFLTIAPEVLLGEEYSFNFDWWGFGIIIYELLHGIVSLNYLATIR